MEHLRLISLRLLGGYLYDLSHSYAASWLISFGAGLISSLLAMDLLLQGNRTRTVQVASAPETTRLAQTP